MVESIVRGFGNLPPKVTAVREFLEAFHDEQAEQLRPLREVQRGVIFPANANLNVLQAVQSGCVRPIAWLYAEQGAAHHIATIDEDATIIESHKRWAYPHYKGRRGYRPMVTMWDGARLLQRHREKADSLEALPKERLTIHYGLRHYHLSALAGHLCPQKLAGTNQDTERNRGISERALP